MSIPQFIAQQSGHAAGSSILGPIGTMLGIGANTLIPVEFPDYNEITNAWLKADISHFEFQRLARTRGVVISNYSESAYKYCKAGNNFVAILNNDYLEHTPGWWESILRGRFYRPSITEAGYLFNRELISPALYNFILRKECDDNRPLAEAWKQANFEIPGPQDLVRFAVREAYNPELITLFGYNKEVPTEVLSWMNKQGYGGDTGINIPAGGTDGNNVARLGKASWFDLYWWAHWELPSLTQGYDMLHKLYSNSPFGRSPLADINSTFDPLDMEKLQKAQDIPDYWRKRLQSISYNPIDKVDSKHMYWSGTITKEQYYHIVRQHGQSNGDSIRIVDDSFTRISKSDLESMFYRGIVGLVEYKDGLKQLGYRNADADKLIDDAYTKISVGVGDYAFENFLIKEDKFREILRHNGYRGDNIDLMVNITKLKQKRNMGVDPAKESLDYVCEYYKLGIITDNEATNMLAKNGYDADDTLAFLAKCKLEIKGDTVKVLLAAIQQSYYRGLYSDEEVKVELLRHSLNPAVIEWWLARWKYKKNLKYKPASTKQNIKAFSQGLINESVLTLRLFNLDYDTNSISLMIRIAKQDMAAKQSAAINKQAKAAVQARKAAAELSLKEQKKKLTKDKQDAKIVTNKAEKRLRNFVKSSTDANIKAWFKDKLIQLWEVYYRLFAKGYTIADADKWVRHNMPDLEEKDYHVSTQKAASKWRSEGNYLE
jgi:hypothetical protein